MAYTEQQKTNCVKIFSEAESVESALIEIKQTLSINPSRRSLENWAKDPQYRPQGRKGELALFNHEPAEDPSDKIIEKLEEKTPKFTREIDELIARLSKNLTDDEIRLMDAKDKLNMIIRLQGVKTKKQSLLAAIIGSGKIKNDDVDSLIEGIAKAVEEVRNEKVIETEVIKEGEINEGTDSLST